MSTQLTEHTNGHDRGLTGVRTYRGRKLEDLIPQIRAELGPDAIILRQREGLMGGVGGFFAQKCVEVDAQAGVARDRTPKIDIYDEDEPVSGWDVGLEDLDAPQLAPATPETPPLLEQLTQALEQHASASAPTAEPAPALEPPAAKPAPAFEPPAAAFEPPAPAIEPPAPQAPTAPATEELSAESFVSRLEQAATHVDIDELVKLVTSGRVMQSPPAQSPSAPSEPVATPAP
jgi:flagellar biosynthesis GTPase FlhF